MNHRDTEAKRNPRRDETPDLILRDSHIVCGPPFGCRKGIMPSPSESDPISLDTELA